MSTPRAANTVDAASLADELARAHVIGADRLSKLLAEFPGGGPLALAKFLIGRGALTAFQADRALAGEARRLTVGPYLLSGVHGSGSFGPVYRAAHRSRPGAFAVTLLPLRSLWQARQAKQYVRTLAALPAHPKLVPLADADSAGGVHYLVWPLAEGETLAARVPVGGPLSPAEVAAVLGDLADVLATCHAWQLPHGLITPATVGLGPHGTRLLGFGAGHLFASNLVADDSLFDTLSTASAAAGLLDYAAPEVLADPTWLTPAADQYALGAVGYFALTGRPPYPNGSLTERLLARQDGPPSPLRELNPDVPADLATLIERTLHPDPSERFGRLDLLRELLPAIAARIDLTRPVLVERGAGSLADAVARDRGSHGGASDLGTWNSGFEVNQPTKQDDSDASVQFDLPEPPPEVACPVQSSETPRPGATEVQPPASHPDAAIPPPIALLTPPPAPSALPMPVEWHTPAADAPADPADALVPNPDAKPSLARPVGWRQVMRNLLFWQAPTDRVQVSVFGPPGVVPGKSARVVVFLHTPEAADSVRTLSRALEHGAELLGIGHLAQEVPRGSDVAVHLAITNAGVSRSLVSACWRGPPSRLGFDLHVPWESPGGPAPGLVSVGRENVRIGKITFELRILPRLM